MPFPASFPTFCRRSWWRLFFCVAPDVIVRMCVLLLQERCHHWHTFLPSGLSLIVARIETVEMISSEICVGSSCKKFPFILLLASYHLNSSKLSLKYTAVVNMYCICKEICSLLCVFILADFSTSAGSSIRRFTAMLDNAITTFCWFVSGSLL